MRCNLFKPLACKTGEFLTFAQYTDDLTRESAGKDTYRVVPSKFVVLNADVNKIFNLNGEQTSKFVKESSNTPQDGEVESDVMKLCVFENTTHEVRGFNNIIPQIFQSNYENSMAILRTNRPELFVDNLAHQYSRYLLWQTLQDAGFLTLKERTENDTTHKYWDEVKYVGDINFHTDRAIDTHHYNEIYCHIPSDAQEFFYDVEQPTNFEAMEFGPMVDGVEVDATYDTRIQGWSDRTYPEHYPLEGYALPPIGESTQNGAKYPLEGLDVALLTDPILRDGLEDGNTFIQRPDVEEYQFNTIILFYDVVNTLDGQVLHRNRPMGIYFTGPVEVGDNGVPVGFHNTFTKYITNNDAYGQGAAFGLRLMTRTVPTPNSSSYEILVANGDNVDEYNTIARALGRISDAIIDNDNSFKTLEEMAQQYKDHLANFKNNRVNVPYPRMVNGQYYWFVNGRNTGQPCSGGSVTPEEPINRNPIWALAEDDSDPETFAGAVCVLDANQRRTGWAIIRKEDINPNSPTYGMVRKFMDHRPDICAPWEVSPANWQPLGVDNPADVTKFTFTYRPRPYAEALGEGKLYLSNGYYEFTQTDIEENSDTSGQTRTATAYNSAWENCVRDTNNPNMITGTPVSTEPKPKDGERQYEYADGRKTGWYTVVSKDDNEFSSTYMKTWETRAYDPSALEVENFTVLVSRNIPAGITVSMGLSTNSLTETDHLEIEKGKTIYIKLQVADGYEFRKATVGDSTTNSAVLQEDGTYMVRFRVSKDTTVNASVREITVPKYGIKFQQSGPGKVTAQINGGDPFVITDGNSGEYEQGTRITFTVVLEEGAGKIDGWYISQNDNMFTKKSNEPVFNIDSLDSNTIVKLTTIPFNTWVYSVRIEGVDGDRRLIFTNRTTGEEVPADKFAERVDLGNGLFEVTFDKRQMGNEDVIITYTDKSGQEMTITQDGRYYDYQDGKKMAIIDAGNNCSKFKITFSGRNAALPSQV